MTKEPRCLETILDASKKKLLKGCISVIIGTEKTLEATAKKVKIPFITISESNQEKAEEKILEICKKYEIDLIVLARYMKILSPNFVWRYPNRIINIHPSLLPKYPGLNTHSKVVKNQDIFHGVTIHYVSSELDAGPIIAQGRIDVNTHADIEELINRIHQVEHVIYPKIINLICKNEIYMENGNVNFKNNSHPRGYICNSYEI